MTEARSIDHGPPSLTADAVPRASLQFIRDEPADDDYFETHTNLARAIAHAIDANPHLRSIGLLGRWGSGKSTVLRQLEKALPATATGKFRIFTYDAWLHQHDPVRRSFIEELLAFTKDEKVEPSKVTDDSIQKLLGHVRVTDVEVTPRLTFDAKVMLYSLLPVPVGLALLRLDVLKGYFGTPMNEVAAATFKTAVALVLMPLWAWALMYIVRRPWRTAKQHLWPVSWRETMEFFRIRNPEGRVNALIPALINQSIKRTSTRTTSSPDPTSIEFSSVFRSIVDDLCADGSRLVVVVDNLDRVPEDEALQIWATVRSFFSTKNAAPDSGQASDPLVILPVDRTAIKRMFSRSHGVTDAPDLAESFIQKTFEVTFEVTQPVQSDWKSFLERQVREAFGDEAPEGIIFWVRKFVQHRYSEKMTSPTPRQINRFVNRLLASYLQWGNDKIPLSVQAFYISHQESIETSFREFIVSEQRQLERASASWQSQIAALFYGVSIDKSTQTLLEYPTITAIQSGKFTEISAYYEVPGFDDSLENFSSDLSVAESDSVQGSDIVKNFVGLMIDAGRPNSDEQRSTWENIASYFVNLDTADASRDGSAATVEELLQHVPATMQEAIINVATRMVSKGLRSGDGKGQKEVRATARSVLDFAGNHGHDEPHFYLGKDAANVVTRLAQGTADLSLAGRYWSDVTVDELDGALAAALNDPIRGSAGAKCFATIIETAQQRVLTKAGDVLAANWPQTMSAASGLSRRHLGDPQTSPALDILLSASGRVAASDGILLEILKDGSLLARFTEAVEANDVDKVAGLAAALLKAKVDFSGGSAFTSFLSKHEDVPMLVTHHLRRMIGKITFYTIWEAYDVAPGARELIRAMVEYGIRNNDLGPLHVDRVTNNILNYLKPVSSYSVVPFIRLVSTYDTFWDKLPETEFSTSFHKTATALIKDSASREKVEAIVLSKLDSLKESDWVAAFKNGGEPIPMLPDVFKIGGLNVADRSPLILGLKDFAAELLSADRRSRGRWLTTVSLLKPKQQRRLFDLAAGYILTVGGGETLAVIKLLGDPLIASPVWAKRADETISGFATRLSSSRPGRAWLKQNSGKVRSWLGQSSSDVRTAFARRLEKMKSGGSEESRYWSEVCLQSWKLDPSG